MTKVGVIGTGNVGAAVVNALVLLQVCRQVVLFGRSLKKAEGEAWDIADAVPLISQAEVNPADNEEALGNSDVVVITSGAKQQAGESRLALLSRNAQIVRSTIKMLDRIAPEAVVIVVSNPVDVLTRVAIEAGRRPAHKIFGSGTVLDTSRLRAELGGRLNVDRKNVHVHVIGEHGDSEFVLWSHTYVGGMKLEEFPLPAGQTPEMLRRESFETARNRAYAIIERKGFTNYAIGVAVAKLVKSVLRDERKIFTVSLPAAPGYNVGEVVLSLPAVIGKNGVETPLTLACTPEEQTLLQASAGKLNEAYRTLGTA